MRRRMAVFFLMLLAAPLSAQASGLLGGLAIQGYDPVEYFRSGEAVPGDPRFVATSGFMTYYFASKFTMEAFLADKASFTPRYGGNCAYQASLGRMIPGDPEIWEIQDGKLYFFFTEESQDAWYTNHEQRLMDANAAWAAYTKPALPKQKPPKKHP